MVKTSFIILLIYSAFFRLAHAAAVENEPGTLHAIVTLKAFTRHEYATPEEKSLAKDFTSTAKRFLKEGSTKEALRVFHKAAELGYGEACGFMAAFCTNRDYGLKPEWADMYREQVKYWTLPSSRVSGSRGHSAAAPAAGSGTATLDTLYDDTTTRALLSDSLRRRF